MVIRIAIADEDIEYINRIINILERYDNLDILAYTDTDALENAIRTKKIDILLFGSSIISPYMLEDRDFIPVVLWDEENGSQEVMQYRKIYKYQRISKIYQQILEIYAEISGDSGEMQGQNKAAIVAFYSPVGGAGKTTLALAAATKYARQGKRTIYLNLENMASDDCYLPETEGHGISEVAASLEDNINHTLKIQSLLQTKRENLFYLNHFDSPNDFAELSAEEEKQLIEVIQKTGLFDVIIIDMQTVTDEKSKIVFELADRIALIEKPDEMAEKKLHRFYGQAYIMNEYGRKMVRILNFYTGHEKNTAVDITLLGRINAAQNPDAAQFITAIAEDISNNYLLNLV